jgi:hypothetical protein
MKSPECGRRLSAPIPEAAHRAAATRSLQKAEVWAKRIAGLLSFFFLKKAEIR